MRPSINTSCVQHMTTFIERMSGCTHAEAEAVARDKCRANYQPKTAVLVKYNKPNVPEIVAEDLMQCLNYYSDDIVSPSGSFYMKHERKIGIATQVITELGKERKYHKKLMLQAAGVGDTETEQYEDQQQGTVKVGMNSMPGGMGYAPCIWYDKANYNTITSLGRNCIAQSYTTAEYVLGGNMAFFSEDEIINHIIIHLSAGIDEAKVRRVLATMELRKPGKGELYAYYNDAINKYVKTDIPVVYALIQTLSDEEVAFFWYFQNLRHIVWDNPSRKDWIDQMFDLTEATVPDTSHIQPDDLYKLDEELVPLVAVSFPELFQEAIDDDIQTMEYPKKCPHLAIRFVAVAQHVQKILDQGKEMFDLFVYTPFCTPELSLRRGMQRNTVVLSDTDSVIFTLIDWVEWYAGTYFTVTDKTLKIASLGIYWLSKAVGDALHKYSISLGALGEYASVMHMKNEFLYLTMLIFEVKKTYAGQVLIREGVRLKKIKNDIKGVLLRGSDVCKETNQAVEDLLIKHILERTTSKLSAKDLITYVVKFEQKIINSVQNGETTFLKQQSVKMEGDYKNPMSSSYFYYLAWQELFAEDYGGIRPPTKTPVISLHEPTKAYEEFLYKNHRNTYNRWVAFYKKYGKYPTNICINPVTNRIPKELVPIIDLRSLVYHNSKAMQLVLKQLNITPGFDTKDKFQALFSDVYGEDSKILGT